MQRIFLAVLAGLLGLTACSGCSGPQSATPTVAAVPAIQPGASSTASKPSTAAAFDEFYHAIEVGDRQKVDALLAQHPALVNGADAHGYTALHAAAGAISADDPDLLKLLIDKGAKVTAANEDGMTPLHLAQSATAVALLLQHGADINGRAKDGSTPLHAQAAESADTGALEVIEALLKAGADASLKDNDGKTPLDIARRRQEPEKIKLLQPRTGK